MCRYEAQYIYTAAHQCKYQLLPEQFFFENYFLENYCFKFFLFLISFFVIQKNQIK